MDESTSSKKPVFLALIIIVIVIAGAIFFLGPSEEDDQDEKEFVAPSSEDQRLYEAAFKNTDQAYCSQIQSQVMKGKCDALFEKESDQLPNPDVDIYQKAFKTNDASLCQQITDQKIRQKCDSLFDEPVPLVQATTNDDQASLTGQDSAQQDAPEVSDMDYYQKAFKNNDIAYCNQIKDSKIKERCKNLFT